MMKKSYKTNIDYIPEVKKLKLVNNGVIGLMGGSFNPPHYGHLQIAEAAIRKFNLTKVVWLVSPLNPLKSKSDLLPLAKRVALCQELTKHNPKIIISTLESAFNNSYTYYTIKELTKFISPSTKLLWLMGEDNLYNFDKFKDWQKIAATIPLVAIARNSNSSPTLLQKAPSILKKYYISPNTPNKLYKKLPAWSFWLTKTINISSTAIRKKPQLAEVPNL